MRSGRRRHRIGLESPPVASASGSRNTFGQVKTGDPSKWTAQGTFWARVQPMAGREIAIASELRGDVTHTIEMRYVPGVLVTWRARFRGRVLNFREVVNVGELNKEYRITAQEVLPT